MLNSQQIAKRCAVLKWTGKVQQPMIWPFIKEKTKHPCGNSYGLSGASYDLRIGHDLYLPPHPVWELRNSLKGSFGSPDFILKQWLHVLESAQPPAQLAYTLEWLTIPDDVCGFIVDKSSFARRFVSAMNTLFDPGFQGHGVLELVNLGTEPVTIKAGEPICQMAFNKLSRKTDRPYRGKYQGQTAEKHGARIERADGSWHPLT